MDCTFSLPGRCFLFNDLKKLSLYGIGNWEEIATNINISLTDSFWFSHFSLAFLHSIILFRLRLFCISFCFSAIFYVFFSDTYSRISFPFSLFVFPRITSLHLFFLYRHSFFQFNSFNSLQLIRLIRFILLYNFAFD